MAHIFSNDGGGNDLIDERECEDTLEYGPGGYHPVDLGDFLGDAGRYRVIHKLGNGLRSTIWLCRDLESQTPCYVALKILAAEVSTDDCPELRVLTFEGMGLKAEAGGKYICLPLDFFRVNGPNGMHFCFTYPVCGPRASEVSWFPPKSLRNLAAQAVQALATLHKYGICHGSFMADNILLKISGLDGLSEDDVIRILGKPQQWRVGKTELNQLPADISAPKCIVHPVSFTRSIISQLVTHEIYLVDFAGSFEVSSPPDLLYTDRAYFPPECLLDKRAGLGSDLWAMGCAIFEIRTGLQLFMGDVPEEDEMLRAEWECWQERFQEGTVIELQRMKLPFTFEDQSFYERMPKDEQRAFGDLVSKTLRQNPSDRLSANAAMEHEWFKM